MYPIFPFKCLSLSQFGVGSALFIFTLSLLPFPFFSSPYFPSSFTMNSHKVCFHDLINYLSAILLFLHVADFGYKSDCFPPISKFTILCFFFVRHMSLCFFTTFTQLPWILCYQLYLDFYIFMPLLIFLPKRILFSLFENRDHMFVILCSLIGP